jgi:hypothetical protein
VFKAFYDSGWHHPGIALAGVLLALIAFASRQRFLVAWFVLFAFAIAIDAVFTGALRPTAGGDLDSTVGIAFVILGDLRYFLVVEWALRLPRGDGAEAAARRRGLGPALPWIVALVLAFVVPVLSAIPQKMFPGAFPRDAVGLNRIFLLYESIFFLFALLLRLVILPRRLKGANAGVASWVTRLTDFEIAQYGLWILADVLIITTQVDVAHLLRIVPNVLYYAVFVPVVWWSAPRWIRDDGPGTG